MNQKEIEDLIIELLAEDEGCSPDDLRKRLKEAGDDLPVDSVLAAEVVARVEQRCGVQLPTTAETARCLRSVRDFASMVYDLIQSSQATRAGEGA